MQSEVEIVRDDDIVESPYRNIKDHLQRENSSLTGVLERVTGLKQTYDSVQLSKDIKILQDASRIQNMSGEIRSLMLFELQRRKLIKQVIDGERF